MYVFILGRKVFINNARVVKQQCLMFFSIENYVNHSSQLQLSSADPVKLPDSADPKIIAFCLWGFGYSLYQALHCNYLQRRQWKMHMVFTDHWNTEINLMFYEVKLFKGIFDMGHYFRHSCIQDLVNTLKNKGASRCHRITFLSKLFHKEPFRTICFTKGYLWWKEGSTDYKKVRKRWFFKEPLTE